MCVKLHLEPSTRSVHLPLYILTPTHSQKKSYFSFLLARNKTKTLFRAKRKTRHHLICISHKNNPVSHEIYVSEGNCFYYCFEDSSKGLLIGCVYFWNFRLLIRFFIDNVALWQQTLKFLLYCFYRSVANIHSVCIVKTSKFKSYVEYLESLAKGALLPWQTNNWYPNWTLLWYQVVYQQVTRFIGSEVSMRWTEALMTLLLGFFVQGSEKHKWVLK